MFKLINIIEHIITKYPNMKWNWNDIQENPTVTARFIIENCPSIDYELLSYNTTLDPVYIENNKDKNWDWEGLAVNKVCTLEFIEKHMDWPWDYTALSDVDKVNESFLEKYMDKPWNWHNLSTCPSISIDFILKHNDKDWAWFSISRWKATYEAYKKNPDMPWNMRDLWTNKNMPVEFYYETADKTPEDFNWIFSNRSLSDDDIMRFVRDHSPFSPEHEDKWEMHGFLRSSRIPMSFIEEHIDDPRIDWSAISLNDNITEDFILRYISKPWVYRLLCTNSNLSLDFIKTHVVASYEKENDDFIFNRLSRNPNITPEFILEHKDKAWDWITLSVNPHITTDLLRQLPDKNWDYYGLNLYNMTPEYILENAKETWNWKNIFRLRILTVEDVIQNAPDAVFENNWIMPYVPLSSIDMNDSRVDMEQVSYNTALTVDFVEKNIDKLDIEALVNNRFQRTYKTYKKNINRLSRLLPIIQNRFIERYYDPSSDLCKDRLKRTFEEMIQYASSK